ncbi:MAG: coenzyme-B sulfoethylthiotransferase subunit alpha, partial [Methermicoccaceae archaeon]
MVDREQMFKKALEIKFTQDWGDNKASEVSKDITSKKAKYLRLGSLQSPRKQEFAQYGKEIAAKRGLPGYDPNLHLGGIPLGQRQITPYLLSSTDVMCDGDDIHFV